VLRQTFNDFEWIVIDGGSADGTVDDLGRIGDPRLRFVSETDEGIFHGMQKGLDRATGCYTVFMNAGDVFFASDTLALIHAALADDTPDLVYGDSVESDGETSFHKPARALADNSYVMFTHHQAQLYRTEIVRAIGFDRSYLLSCDWVLTTRVLARPGATMLYVPTPLCIFERGGISQQGAQRALLNRELFRIYRREQQHSLPRAAVYWLKKVGINKARSLAPGLYDRMRYRGRRVSTRST
jgi:putative colanic acid biosynthesis glycosyltransferase